MTKRTAHAWPLVLCALLLAAPPAGAQVPPEGDAVAARTFGVPELAIENVHQPPARLPREMASRLHADLAALRGGRPAIHGFYDLRAGRWGTLVLAVPLVPGRGVGNTLTWDALGRATPDDDAAFQDAVWHSFKAFLEAQRHRLGVDPAELASPTIGSYDGGRVVQVMAKRVVGGVPVRNSFVKGTLNNGNLVLFGTHNWGDVSVATAPAIAAERAQETVAARLAGFKVRGWRRPQLVIVPAASGEAGPANEGRGYRYLLAWAVGPQVEGSGGTWEGLVDAQGGRLLAFYDMNLYADQQKVTGGVFPVSNDGQSPGGIPDGVEQAGFPMSRAFVFRSDGTRLETNSEGLVSVSGEYRTHLTGPFLRIVDNCGTIDESTTCPVLDLGTSGGTDCAVPPGRSPGNTHSARTGFYEVNRLIDQAKSWMGATATPNAPGGWLHRQLPANMNINNSCNAFFSPADTGSPTTGSINFYRQFSSSPNSGLCRNTGEIAAVFDHEWGHGLDSFDNAGGVSLPGEAYADMTAVMRLNTSCIGRGFFTGGPCGGNGDPCTECTGVREIDWKKRLSGRPHTLRWVLGQDPTVPGSCGGVVVPPTPFNSGPCQRSTHCEGTIIGEAMWDLLKRDLRCHGRRWETFAGGPVAGGRCTAGAAPTMDENTALVLATRLFYLAGEGVTLGYQCDQTFTVAGCNAGSWYLNILAADDDDGDPANGTPHMVAIHDAFLRHGISCPSDSVPPTVANFGCVLTPAPTVAPTVTATAGNQSATISWTAVPGATEYWVLRTDGVHGCSFGKTRVARIPATAPLSYSEDGLADGLTYYYSVVAVGGALGVPAESCSGPMSDCAAVTPLPPALASAPGAAIDDRPDGVAVETGDGDPFVDNCEVAGITFDVVNTGGVNLTNVRITAIAPSTAETRILTPLPIQLGVLESGCNGGGNAKAAANFRFQAGGLPSQSTLTFTVAVEADQLSGPVTGTLTVKDTETDLVLDSVLYDFEAGEQGWTTFSGTFNRTSLPPPGAEGSAFYMKSSTAHDDACDRSRSPKLRLTATSTLSLYNQFLTEAETPETPFYDRGNVGIVNAQGQTTIVSPDGGRLYNALNSYTGCNNGPGWATSAAQPNNPFAQSTWSAAALGAAGWAGQEVQIEVAYGTDALASLEGFQFDQVRLTDVLLKAPDRQDDVCNHPPVAEDDSASTAEDTPVTIVVLANDSDPDGDALTVSGVSDPPNGTATRNPDNTVTYNPDPNFFGTDTFAYQACDPDGLCDPATVTVTVSPVNDRPDARDDAAGTPKNTSVTIAVLANDTDPDGDALNVRSVTQPANGTATRVNGDTAVRYTPRSGFVGTDTFTYTACDRPTGGLCDTATVTVTVTPANRPPDADGDKACTSKNRPVTINVLANDSDPDGDALSVTVTRQPANGTAVRNPDNTVTYTPRSGFVGSDAFRYKACDGGGLCDEAKVEVTVTRRPDCRDEDDDDHDDDGERDDSDRDDDNDGQPDDSDDDDDNDGESDAADDDDDNDGIHDDFDSPSSQQMQSGSADEAEAGHQVSHAVGADANTLLLAAVAEGPPTSSLVVQVYDPQGVLLVQAPSVAGRAVVVAPTALAGSYTVRVRNAGAEATGFSTTIIRSQNWILPTR